MQNGLLTSIRPSNSLGNVPSTQVPFILLSMFSSNCIKSRQTRSQVQDMTSTAISEVKWKYEWRPISDNTKYKISCRM